MALFDFRDSTNAMHDLLERERRAILEGRFDILERLTAEKERLVQRISHKMPSGPELRRLREMSERNSRLLAAMRDGLRDAQARIDVLRRKPQTLHTYDASGRKTTLGGNVTPTNLRR